jgi:hypothetical protein
MWPKPETSCRVHCVLAHLAEYCFQASCKQCGPGRSLLSQLPGKPETALSYNCGHSHRIELLYLGILTPDTDRPRRIGPVNGEGPTDNPIESFLG